MDRPLIAVVLAGGVGTRLYPASRSHRPKQFRSFDGEASLLSRTVERVGFADEVYVVTCDRFAEEVEKHAPGAGMLVEPAPKDTGPALVYAAHLLRDQVGECVLLCLPSDHRVSGAFEGTARTAARAAVETGGLVAIGVEPDRPATGYGYVEPGQAVDGYHEIERFHEKPGAGAADDYVDRGWLWNAGIFSWTPAALLDAARDSDLAPLVAALEDGDPDAGFAVVDSASVDYAVMEDADDGYVVPAAFEWDDLGTWDALERVAESEGGNTVLGDALVVEGEGNVIAGNGHVSLVGVDDLVVAVYDDRVLVVPKGESQRVREVVAALREQGLF